MTCVRFSVGALVCGLVGVTLLATRPAAGQAQTPNDGQQWRYFNQPLLYQAGGFKHADPEFQKLLESEAKGEGEVARLVAEYSHTESDTQRGKIKSKLADVLDKQFDMQQKRRELEVAQIEAQLKKLRELMRKRNDARQTIVEKRLDQLLREADGLGWTSPSGGTRFYRGAVDPGTLQAK